LRRYCNLTILQNGSRRHLEFSEIQVFNGGCARGTHSVSSYRISLISVNPLLRWQFFDFSRWRYTAATTDPKP